MNFGFLPSLPVALTLLLALAISALSAHVALELASRARVARITAGLPWLLGAAVALALGLWSSQVIGLRAESLPFAVGYALLDSAAAFAAAVVVGLAGLAVVSGQVVTPLRIAGTAAVFGIGIVCVQTLTLLSAGLQPGIMWDVPLLLLAFAGVTGGSLIALAAFFLGGDRTVRRSVARQLAPGLLLGASVLVSQQLVVRAAGIADQQFSAHAAGVSSETLLALATVGSTSLLLVGLLLSSIESQLRRMLRGAETELQRRTFRDSLTRLPNRLMFEGNLAHDIHKATSAQERMALLFVDLDGFKPVNESLGHRAGDIMLREIAARLKRFARPEDRIGHLGGDEFVMLVRGNPMAQDAAIFAERLLAAIGEPCSMDGREAVVSGSIGIAMFPEHGTMSDLLARAEAAMRVAKAGGGATYCFFAPHMLNGAREQHELLRDLRRALAEGQLELLYQPKVHAPSGEITGAEALMRWNHPERGLVPPAVFIPIAERFGLIGAIGNWLVEEACRQAAKWREEGLRMRVAINLSAHQLRHADLADRIASALRRHAINPQLLTCEITESVAMEDASNALRMVEKIDALGVNISIDDFGTGYSSLAYLRQLNAGELKIDRSFVLDIETSADARAVVDAVVKLAQALGLKVVAEGVETEAQHQILRALGCHELQGYLFARPMTANALSAWAMDEVGADAMEFRESLYRLTAPGALH